MDTYTHPDDIPASLTSATAIGNARNFWYESKYGCAAPIYHGGDCMHGKFAYAPEEVY